MIKPKPCTALLLFVTMIGANACAQQTGPAPERGGAPADGVSANTSSEPEADALGRSILGTELDAILEQVAAAEGREFLVDPRVAARVHTVPEIENPTYEALLSILRIHGYIAVEIEGRINIVPSALARQYATRVLQRDDSSVSDDELVTRVLTLNTDNAAPLVPVLRPLMPQYAHLAAQGNKLIIVDHYDNVRRITELSNVLSE